MKPFRFQCDDAFTIHGLGLVLVGALQDGELRSSQLIEIPTNSGRRIGRIDKLELNRVLVEHIDTDANIGILISKFNDPTWMAVLRNLPTDEFEAEAFGSVGEKFGLEFPCVLTGPLSEAEFVDSNGHQ